MTPTQDDDIFDQRWLHKSTREYQSSKVPDIAALKVFAYEAFDSLDQDRNGFLSRQELLSALQNDALDNRSKSFVMFLLNNHGQIQEMNDERADKGDGISRADLEFYFQLLANLL